MSDFRCPRYWWDGNHWRCQNLPDDYLDLHDYDTYCTSKTRCLECPYMDSEVRERMAEYKKKAQERIDEFEEERKREFEEERKGEFEENGPSRRDYGRSNDSDYVTPKHSSSSDSDDGCLGALFGLVFTIIGAILKLLWPICKIVFLYYCIPVLAGWTWLVFLPIAFVPTGIVPLAVAAAVAAGACFVAFWPYGIMVLTLKVKKQITTKQQLSFYGKWFLKGPFAYKDLKEFKERIRSK